MYKCIGEYIKITRKEQKITQQQLANKLYCSQQYIVFIESGERVLSQEYLLPLSKALGFDFIQLMREQYKYKTIKHYLISHKLVDLLQLAKYDEIEILLNTETTVSEFNYGSPLIIKEYCRALILVNKYSKDAEALIILLDILGIENRNEIENFIPTYNNEGRYYSCIALLSIVLCNMNEQHLSKILLKNSIDFIESEYFNDVLPLSAIDNHYKKIYIVLMNNYADDMFKDGNYIEALDICNKVESAIVMFETNHLLELVLKLKFEILYKLNMIEHSQRTYDEFFTICIIKKNYSYLLSTNNIIKQQYILLKTKDH